MADYSKQIALANKLISAKGAAFTFKTTDQTPADPTKPWEGGAGPVTGSLYGVAVPPSSASQLGIGQVDEDLIKKSKVILIVAPGDGSVNPRNFNQVSFQGSDARISFVEELNPDANAAVLFFVGLER